MRPADMVAALRVPRAKLAKRDLDSAEQRVVTLRELLGDEAPTLADTQRVLLDAFAKRFGIDWVAGELTDEEMRLARQRFDEEIGQDEFVAEIDDPAGAGDLATGERTGPGGTVTTYLRLDGPQGSRVSQILITGDFFVAPPRTVYDLEGAIRGCPTDDVPAEVERFFRKRSVSALSVTPDDFLESIKAALASARVRRAEAE
jgi:lipoate-protein ligase A